MTSHHTVTERTPELVDQLTRVWERSVRATHTFLSEAEVAQIKPYVPQAIAGVGTLVVAEKDDAPVGFMGVEGGRLEMLLLDPDVRGRGLGRRLLEHGTSAWASRPTAAPSSTRRAAPTRCSTCVCKLGTVPN